MVWLSNTAEMAKQSVVMPLWKKQIRGSLVRIIKLKSGRITLAFLLLEFLLTGAFQRF